MSRIGVIGSVTPDYFAENVGDLLRHLGHVVTNLDRFGPAAVAGSSITWQDWPARSCDAWMNAPRTGSHGPPLDVGCEVVINLDAYLMPCVVSRLLRPYGGGSPCRVGETATQAASTDRYGAHRDHTYDLCVTDIVEKLS